MALLASRALETPSSFWCCARTRCQCDLLRIDVNAGGRYPNCINGLRRVTIEQFQRCAQVAMNPLIAPLHERDDDGEKRSALIGEMISLARTVIANGLSLEKFVLDEMR